MFDQSLEGRFIELSVLEWSNDRSVGAGKHFIPSSDLDRPLEDELRRAGKFHIKKLAIPLREADLETVTPLHLHLHRRFEAMDTRRNQRGRSHPRAAGERLALDAA